MAVVRRSFSVLEPAPRVWAALADFSGWSRLLTMKDARAKGWGNRFMPRARPAAGVALDMLYDAQPMQDWVVEEWTPPERMSLSSRRWLGPPAYAMASRLSVALRASSPVETLVGLELESRFCAVPWGPILNVITPLRRELRLLLAGMEEGLVQLLSERSPNQLA